MKFGIRKPSLKKSLKARTTGKLKRTIKRSLIPGYGKKGSGWVNNPKKAAYNKIYHKTSFGVSGLFKALSFTPHSKSRSKSKKVIMDTQNTNFSSGWKTLSDPDTIAVSNSPQPPAPPEPSKTPFYLKTWFIAVISIFVPYIGVIFTWTIWKNKWNRSTQIKITAVLSLYSLIIFLFLKGSNDPQPVSTESSYFILETESSNESDLLSELYESEENAIESESSEEIISSAVSSEPPKSTYSSEVNRDETYQAPITSTPAEPPAVSSAPEETYTAPSRPESVQSQEQSQMVWIPTNGGTKYHTYAGCSNMKNPIQVTLSEATAQGYTPCKRCH